MTISHKIELIPNNKAITYFKKAFGCSRLAYNWVVCIWIRETFNKFIENFQEWICINDSSFGLKAFLFSGLCGILGFFVCINATMDLH